MRAHSWLHFLRQLSSCSNHKAIQQIKDVLKNSGNPGRQGGSVDWLARWRYTQEFLALFSVNTLRSGLVQTNYFPVASHKVVIHRCWRNKNFERLIDYSIRKWLARNVPLLLRHNCTSCEIKHKSRRGFPRRRIFTPSSEAHTDHRTRRVTHPTFFNSQILKLISRTEHQFSTFKFPRLED